MTLSEIIKQNTDVYVSEMALAGYTVEPTTWSIVNLERLSIFIFSFCQFVSYNKWDVFKNEIDETIANDKTHSRRWYQKIIGDFQYGYTVDKNTLKYDNTGLSDSVVEDSKIVKYRAVTEDGDSLNVKVAKLDGDDLAKLADDELEALKDYMENEIYGQKDAGVFLTFINKDADSLLLNLQIFYMPTVLTSNGVEISSGKETVRIATKDYLKNIQFNGVFTLQDLVDALQKVRGVKLIKINTVQVKADGASDYQTVDVFYLPSSGYLRFIDDADLTLTFTPYEN